MKRWQLALTVMTALALFGSVRQASAQYGSGRSMQYGRGLSSPRLSPWLNLFRREGGSLDNYHRFVRRDIQLRDTLKRQQYGLQRQATAINSLGNQFLQAQQNAAVRPTGTGSVFMNYSHYYPQGRAMGGGR